MGVVVLVGVVAMVVMAAAVVIGSKLGIVIMVLENCIGVSSLNLDPAQIAGRCGGW